jgi:hypothetical protein
MKYAFIAVGLFGFGCWVLLGYIAWTDGLSRPAQVGACALGALRMLDYAKEWARS